MYKYNCSCIGREKFAIGITYQINHSIESSIELTEDQIRMALYEKYEHINHLRFILKVT